jgi:two-component system nitrate/nitrite response regulator NarL
VSGAGPRVRVALVDDHALLVQSLALALGAHDLDVVALDPAVPLDPPDDGVDVVLLDLALGEGRWGLDLLPELQRCSRAVVVLTGETDERLLGDALLAGCLGAVPKSAPVADIVEAVRAAAAGERLPVRWADPAWAAASRRDRVEQRQRLADFDRLTGRERDVLTNLVEGRDVGEIAQEAVVSVATVRSQVRGVLTKLGVSSQLQAVARARRAGWRSDRRDVPG